MSIEIKNGKIYIDDKGFSEETLKEMVKDHYFLCNWSKNIIMGVTKWQLKILI